MTVAVFEDLYGRWADDAWHIYFEAFRELNTLAVQRHLMTRAEFDQVAADKRIGKFLHLHGDRVDGVAAFTNQLDAVPLISEAYFERRWPHEHAAGRIWYCPFVAVRRCHLPDTGAFQHLIEAMWDQADGGTVIIDLCSHNQRRGMPAAVQAILERHSGPVDLDRLDEQTYLAYRPQT